MTRWQPIDTAPKEPVNQFGYGPAILLRVGDFVVSDQWKPGLPEYPLQSHWRNWPYVQPREAPTHWAPLDPLPQSAMQPSAKDCAA